MDGIERGLRVWFDVSIVDAENDGAALVARMKPIEDECSSAPYMKVTCGRGGKADACHVQDSIRIAYWRPIATKRRLPGRWVPNRTSQNVPPSTASTPGVIPSWPQLRVSELSADLLPVLDHYPD